MGFDGVVRIDAEGELAGTGALLYGGRAILTAAHVIEEVPPDELSAFFSVLFHLADGVTEVTASSLVIHPEWDTDDPASRNDIGILFLDEPAPPGAERYDIFRALDEDTGKPFTKVGFGIRGTGAEGTEDFETAPVKRYGWNEYDFAIDLDDFYFDDGTVPDLSSDNAQGLIFDFDDGSAARDASGQYFGITDRGFGADEVNTTNGDSGGPGFVEGRLAGITSFGLGGEDGVVTDNDDVENSSFGEFSVDTRVAFFDRWIDEQMQASFPDRPQSRDEVVFEIAEGDDGTTLAYFFLELSSLLTREASVSYRTVSGTAQAGEDFIPASGEVVLYPGQENLVIPVEILGDIEAEPDEVFSLEIFAPLGAGFPGGATSLSASRTILDDDGIV
jgi:secreted trypsin-like serine protease